MSACAPYVIRHKHVLIDETATLKVVERSAEKKDINGEPLSAATIDQPVKYIITRLNYVVTIRTPIANTSAPGIRLVAENEKKERLIIRGPHILELPRGIEWHDYVFSPQKAEGAALEFDVVSEQGEILGHEKINYKLITHGCVTGVEWI